MGKTLIYYKPEYIEEAKKLQENYIAHQNEADIISEEIRDDIAYAKKNKYKEAIFIEDPDTVVIHDTKSCFTNRCPISEVYYK